MKKIATKITLADIAREARVGVATVDRVLNKRAAVKESTARRVLEAARRLWGPAADRTAPADWLEHDLEIALPDQRRRLTILAEGGYALRDTAGCTAISPVLAERLLAASQAVPSRATPDLTA